MENVSLLKSHRGSKRLLQQAFSKFCYLWYNYSLSFSVIKIKWLILQWPFNSKNSFCFWHKLYCSRVNSDFTILLDSVSKVKQNGMLTENWSPCIFKFCLLCSSPVLKLCSLNPLYANIYIIAKMFISSRTLLCLSVVVHCCDSF